MLALKWKCLFTSDVFVPDVGSPLYLISRDQSLLFPTSSLSRSLIRISINNFRGFYISRVSWGIHGSLILCGFRVSVILCEFHGYWFRGSVILCGFYGSVTGCWFCGFYLMWVSWFSHSCVWCSSYSEQQSVQVSTVDAFQGGERGVIILSCVRTHSVGFIDSDKYDFWNTFCKLEKTAYFLFFFKNLHGFMILIWWIECL